MLETHLVKLRLLYDLVCIINLYESVNGGQKADLPRSEPLSNTEMNFRFSSSCFKH